LREQLHVAVDHLKVGMAHELHEFLQRVASGTGLDCDEFPFKSTEQGGEFGVLRTGKRPSLKSIDHSANRALGKALYDGDAQCAMRMGTPQPTGNAIGGGPFLVVPIPIGMKTRMLCNGKSAQHQP
jgi:hypothetical protein